jgi:hypothetical protein
MAWLLSPGMILPIVIGNKIVEREAAELIG